MNKKTRNEIKKYDYSLSGNWKLIVSGLFTGSYPFFNFFVLKALLNNNELVKLYLIGIFWDIPYVILTNMGSSIFFDKGKKQNFKGLSLISKIIFVAGIILFFMTRNFLLLFGTLVLPFNLYIQIASEKLSRDKYKYLPLVSIAEIVFCMLGNVVAFMLLKSKIDYLTLYYVNYFIIILLVIVPMYRATSKVPFFEIILTNKSKYSLKQQLSRLKLLYLRSRPRNIQVILFEIASIFILKNNQKVANKGIAIIMIRKIHSLLKSTMYDVSYLLKKNIVNSAGSLKEHSGYFNLVYKMLIIQAIVYIGVFVTNTEYDKIYLLNGIITSLLIFYMSNAIVIPKRYYLIHHKIFRITAIASFVDTFIILVSSILLQDIFVVQIIRILATGINAMILSYGYYKLSYQQEK